jgi:hypothetical protein
MRFDDLWMELEHIDRVDAGASRTGREIAAYRFSSEEDTTPEGTLKSAAFIEGGVHANEWASPEVVAAIFEWLALERDTDVVLRYLLENTVTLVHPLTNPDGFIQTQVYYDSTVNGDGAGRSGRDGRMRRKNLRGADENLETLDDHLFGIDLNRNHFHGFGEAGGEAGAPSASDDPTSLFYSGLEPGTEPESQALYVAGDFARVAGEDRIRFYAAFHSVGPLYFMLETENEVHGRVQTRVYEAMRDAIAATTGINYPMRTVGPIGATAQRFQKLQGCVAYGPEIRGRAGSPNGWILPDADIDEIRGEHVEATRAGLYFMAGPPALLEVAIHDAADIEAGPSIPVYRETRVYNLETDAREQQVLDDRPLLAGKEYVAVLRFNKPMRLLDAEIGEATVLPGQADVALSVRLGTIASGKNSRWIFDGAGEPLGYRRYPGDTVHVTLDLSEIEPCGAPPELAVFVGDLVGQALDADPRTVADWSAQAWVDYETVEGVEGIDGGSDSLAEVQTDGPLECGPIAPWVAADVGEPLSPGEVVLDGACLRLAGGVGLLAGRADAFHFAYQEVSGDAVITARLGDGAPSSGAWVGLMLRESLEPGARHFTLQVTNEGTMRSINASGRRTLFTRPTASQTLSGDGLRLERRGDEFVALHSPDGVTWDELHRETIEFSAAALIGVGVAGDADVAFASMCDIEITEPRGVAFRRGDCNANGEVDISDGRCILDWRFSGAATPGCVAATNTNGDAVADIADAIYLFSALFLGGPPPVEPFPGCGPPGEGDVALGCATPPAGCL